MKITSGFRIQFKEKSFNTKEIFVSFGMTAVSDGPEPNPTSDWRGSE